MNLGDQYPKREPTETGPRPAAGAVDDEKPIDATDAPPHVRGSLLLTIGGRVSRDPRAIVGLVIVAVIATACLLAPLIGRYNPNLPDITVLNQGPSAAHWLGTDDLGRDMWARILWGGRASLPAGLEIVAFSFLVGVPLGMVAGLGGKFMEEGIMRFVDLLLAVPGLLLAIAVVAVLGPSLKSVVVGLGIAGIPGYARVARAATLRLREMEYVEASRSAGAGLRHITVRHVFPNIVDSLVILSTLHLGTAILAAAALSFLGIGTQLPDADWGTLLSVGYEHMFLQDTELIFPAVVIVATVLGINLIGDALGDALNPKARSRRI